MTIKRTLALIMTVILILLLFPAAAFAADINIDISADDAVITAGDGNNYIITGTGIYRGITVTGAGEANITLNNVDIMHEISPFIIEPGVTVNLTLVGDNVILNDDEGAGINVPQGATLKITSASTGKLTATGRSGAAGIGGNENESAGTIIIEGGVVEAQGGHSGAGIGGGYSGDGGAINILGNAQVLATGGIYAAGIGGGYKGSGGTVNISGNAQVEATGSNEGGAGIGGGCDGNAGIINISGGTVTAISSDYAAGIGTGGYGYSGEINISGGTVYAECVGSNGAGIGSGEISVNENECVVNISGGTVEAVAGWSAAGIGGGQMGSGGIINISGGIVTAATYNGGAGAGIGGGSGGANGGIITISGGTVFAQGGVDGGAGIGGGYDGNGADVIITGGNVEALKGHDAAQDIGYGRNGYDSGTLTNGADDVFLTIISFDIISKDAFVTSITTAPGYGTNDIYNIFQDKLHLFLPSGTSTTEVVADFHTYSGEIITGDDAENPTEGTLYRENTNPSVSTLSITIPEIGQTATFVLNFGSGSLQADSYVLGPQNADIVSASPDSGGISAPVTITVTALSEGTTIIDVITFRSFFTHSMFQINVTVGEPGDLDPIPHTGDNSDDTFILWLLLGISALGIMTLILLRKKFCHK